MSSAGRGRLLAQFPAPLRCAPPGRPKGRGAAPPQTRPQRPENCDDKGALSIAAANLNAVSLHGCTAAQAGAPTSRPEAVVVGGLNATLKTYLHDALRAAGFQTIDGSTEPDLAGVEPTNICNRMLLGKGAQLELTTELRKSMFTVNTVAGRATSTTAAYNGFVAAVRTAIARLEASGGEQIIL
ncbi:hypothetical protein GCM10010278_19830 [Streptomyces melanogenes]|nr:hypothetical protein GCM10010278_19830 [Streptomyces melanogenes]